MRVKNPFGAAGGTFHSALVVSYKRGEGSVVIQGIWVSSEGTPEGPPWVTSCHTPEAHFPPEL